MTPVAEMKTKTNATPESESANGGKAQDTSSNKSTAPATQKGATLMFGATAGMPGRFKGNFDFQFVRTMGCTTYGGSEIGECYETASRIEDEKKIAIPRHGVLQQSGWRRSPANRLRAGIW